MAGKIVKASKKQVDMELTEQQRLFCRSYFYEPETMGNALQSYLKAYNCTMNTAKAHSYALLKNPKIVNELALYERQRQVEVMCALKENQDILQTVELMKILSVMAVNKGGEYSHNIQLNAIRESLKIQGAYKDTMTDKTKDIKIIVNNPSQEQIAEYEQFKKERDSRNIIDVEVNEDV